MEFADHRRHNVGSLQIIVVMRSVQVCRHTADKVVSILSLVKFAHLQPGDLGDRIGLVRHLERAGKQRVLRDRLRRHLGVDTGASQKQQLFHLKIMAALDDITLDLHIFIGKFRRRRIVGVDASHFCSSQNDHIRSFLLKEGSHRLLICQIQLLMCPSDHVCVAFGFQISDDRASHQSSVSCYIDLVCLIHALFLHRLSYFNLFLVSQSTLLRNPSFRFSPSSVISALAGDDGKLS